MKLRKDGKPDGRSVQARVNGMKGDPIYRQIGDSKTLDNEDVSDIVMARARAKLRRERADARRAEALAGEMEGDLIKATAVRTMLGRFCSAFRRIATQAPTYLEAKGIPEEHLEACKTAVATAMSQALIVTARELESMANENKSSQDDSPA